MIDLRNSTSWHLRVIDFTMMRGHIDNLSFWGLLTTCSYIRALIFGVFWVSVILAVVGGAVASAAMTMILTGILMVETSSWNVFIAFDTASHILMGVFAGSYALPGAIFVAVGVALWLLAFGAAVTVCLMLTYSVVSKIWGAISDAKYARDLAKLEQLGKNPKSAKKVGVISKMKASSTYQILHSVLNKYCVPITTSRSTQKEREAEWEKRWANISELSD